MTRLGLIGGTGLEALPELQVSHRSEVTTRFGSPSSALSFGRLGAADVVFLSRHGDDHEIPPHRVNYRANIRALHDAGVETVVAVAAVGGIASQCEPGQVVIPDQLIDYSWGRESSFWDETDTRMRHVEFEPPFSNATRSSLIDAAAEAGIRVIDGGVYGVTQGPRLETAAEINRMERDGCDIVGMTAMPEAALARELDLDYGILAMVINHAAGRCDGSIHADIEQHLEKATNRVMQILVALTLPVNDGART